MKLMVINGVNLNMLGIREPDLYGTTTYKSLCEYIDRYCKEKNIEVTFFQSNCEGAIVDEIHRAYFDKYDGIVINPGAYTHYSYAILDAIKAVNVPTIEVHLTDIQSRDTFRHISVILPACVAQIAGLGKDSYIKAIDYFEGKIWKNN